MRYCGGGDGWLGWAVRYYEGGGVGSGALNFQKGVGVYFGDSIS